jgi:transcriptional regulator with XRE-family HTH domain
VGRKAKPELLPGLGARLKELRLAAGLKQKDLARAGSGRLSQPVVSQLESGAYQKPSCVLLAEYLTACRASFHDIAQVLDSYTRPLGRAEVRVRERIDEAVRYYRVEPRAVACNYDRMTQHAAEEAHREQASDDERVERAVVEEYASRAVEIFSAQHDEVPTIPASPRVDPVGAAQ